MAFENYPSAREVADLHRNSDLNASLEAQHHSIGKGPYQAAAGTHVHDGTTGEPLLDEVIITGNIGTTPIALVLKQLLQALSDNLGLKDNTTMV